MSYYVSTLMLHYNFMRKVRLQVNSDSHEVIKLERQIEDLAATLVKIRDPQKAEDFLRAILTPGELEQVAQRLQIFKMLVKEIPQRKIAGELGVSIGTITHGSRELKYGSAMNIVTLLK